MIKVADIAYVTYAVADLDRTEQFLTDFGLVRSARTADALYMRGASGAHHQHVSRQYIGGDGDGPGLVGIALAVSSRDELAAATAIPGASAIAAIDEPGGGERVRLAGPEGYVIDLVHGIATLPAMPVRDVLTLNSGMAKPRQGATQRPVRGPAQVLRLGHVALLTRDPGAAADWFTRHLGLIASDYLDDPASGGTAGVFMRCDRGADPSDHHTIAVAGAPITRIHHCSFEVQDFDAVQIGGEWLEARGHRREWGIGRHILGSQIFDYWRDPDGNMIEHYTDSDVFDASVPSERHPAGPDTLFQWGPPPPPSFFT
jgi:catechol 2,3-dioxygenase-like lactoylglutathione lyase family enzyme